MPREITTGEAAEIIGCTRRTIYNLLRDKDLRGRQTGRCTWLVELVSARKYAKRARGPGRPKRRY